jgi:hypothetical protein
MRKRVQVAVVVLLLGAASVVAFQILCPQEREPSYQGERVRPEIGPARDSIRAVAIIGQFASSGPGRAPGGGGYPATASQRWPVIVV